MTEYIDRQEAIDMLMRNAGEYWNQGVSTSFSHALQECANMLENIPAADVRPVVTCDACVWHVDDGFHYCNKWCAPCPDNAEFFCAYGERPNCGARMGGTDDA